MPGTLWNVDPPGQVRALRLALGGVRLAALGLLGVELVQQLVGAFAQAVPVGVDGLVEQPRLAFGAVLRRQVPEQVDDRLGLLDVDVAGRERAGRRGVLVAVERLPEPGSSRPRGRL